MDYKQQYLKYKKKYLLAKKSVGGSIELNEVKPVSEVNKVNKLETIQDKDSKPKKQKRQKKPKKQKKTQEEKEYENMRKIEEIEKETMMELDKLKKTYQVIFDKGLKKKEVIELLKKIHNIGKKIKKKYKFSIQEQYSYLINKNSRLLENNPSINNLILDSFVNYYTYENSNKIDSLLNYLKKNSDIKLANNKLEKYSKGELIGEGSFGKVYSLPNNKVLKVINATMYNLPSNNIYAYEINSIINEINIMNKIKNTNIGPKIFDYWMSKDKNVLNIYIVMEHKGISLNEWLINNKLTETYKKKIKSKIKRLHEMDIIHSDLHESNILVQKNKNNTDFFISDFGLSKTKKDLFNKLKKNDYRIFVDFNSNYYIIQYLSLILKILEIKFIK